MNASKLSTVERLAEEFLQRVVAQDAVREGVLEEGAE